MWISRIRVTGGFLAGIDIALTQGLNVIIGPRGSGKTTLLELLTHALAAGHPDVGDVKRRQQFLAAVLGPDAEIIVDVETEDGGRHVVVDQAGGGQRPELGTSVLALGQNEIEEIASDAQSRLSLLDLRVNASALLPDETSISRLTGALFDLRADLERRREEAGKRIVLTKDRDLLVSQETALMGGRSESLAAQRDLLRLAEERINTTNRELEMLDQMPGEVRDIGTSLSQQQGRLNDLAQRTKALREISPELDEAIATSSSLGDQLVDILRGAHQLIQPARDRVDELNIAAREEASPLRESLDEAEAGLGRLTAQLRNVERELTDLDINDREILALEARYQELSEQRKEAFDAAEQSEEALFAARNMIAAEVTSQTASGVVVDVQHLADSTSLQTFLQTTLSGTRTRTSRIEQVAERVLPRQLLEMIELKNMAGLAAITGLTDERADRLIHDLEHRETLEALSQIRLTDLVDFRLRDGATDKSVDQLSTGQKCAVTLPIVLSEQERILILDQPEDHLDNEFLVQNVLKGLTARSSANAQTIVATHNPNIPVLGSAAMVIALTSDGKSGSVSEAGPFDADEIVKRIESLMEGGRDAFARRYAFYAEHGEVD